MAKILVTGALGQIGSELTIKLQEIYGKDNVLATDIRDAESNTLDCIYEKLDVNDTDRWEELIDKYEITDVYHLAAMLSAVAEKHPIKGWELNTNSLLSLLEMAKNKKVKKIFWPSSIAVYGRDTQKIMTPQGDKKNPLTMYGIAKLAGERFCEYYNKNFDVDVRSIRYPGLISWVAAPGGGTTDYAVEIFYKAIEDGNYSCFLKEDTELPMLYMQDAVRATVELMEAPKENLSVHSSYNLGGLSFTPKEIAEEITKYRQDFTITYEPDFRQNIADTWPSSINDEIAQRDWNWKPEFDLKKMTEVMYVNLKNKLAKK